jgi:hypothetical protein
MAMTVGDASRRGSRSSARTNRLLLGAMPPAPRTLAARAVARIDP